MRPDADESVSILISLPEVTSENVTLTFPLDCKTESILTVKLRVAPSLNLMGFSLETKKPILLGVYRLWLLVPKPITLGEGHEA